MLEYKNISVRAYDKNIWDYCMSRRFLVSVIVTVFNRKENFRNWFYAMSRQTTNFEFEIVIVDDASTDGLEEVIENDCMGFMENRRIKHIKTCTRIGCGKSTYIGASVADGEILAIIGPDMFPFNPDGTLCTNVLSTMVKALDEKTVAVFVDCKVIPDVYKEHIDDGILRNGNDGIVALRNKLGSEKVMFGGVYKEPWFLCGAIRWNDYRQLTDFRLPYQDTGLAHNIEKHGGGVKHITDFAVGHMPHNKPDRNRGIERWFKAIRAEPP